MSLPFPAFEPGPLFAALLSLASIGWLLFLRRNAVRRRRAQRLRADGQAERPGTALPEAQLCVAHLEALTELNRALRVCETPEDALNALGDFVPRLIDIADGALYAATATGDPLRLIRCWGSASYRPTLASDDCLAIRDRLPRVHPAGDARSGVPAGGICVPVVSRDRVDALLILDSAGRDPRALFEDLRIRSTVEEIGLVIGSIRLRESLRQQSIRDPLTGLYNRRHLEELLGRELLRLDRGLRDGNVEHLALLLLDVDRFKRFNDEQGHEAGDLVLAGLGRLLRELARASDIVSRHGGEEFVAVLPGVALEVARERAERIREAVAALRLDFHGEPLPPLTVSIGVAAFPEHGRTPEALLRAADAAMYAAKRAGRNRVCVALPDCPDAPCERPHPGAQAFEPPTGAAR